VGNCFFHTTTYAILHGKIDFKNGAPRCRKTLPTSM
jgi:hypothetical protein